MKPWEYAGAVHEAGWITLAALLILEPNDDAHVWRAFQSIKSMRRPSNPDAVITLLRDALAATEMPATAP